MLPARFDAAELKFGVAGHAGFCLARSRPPEFGSAVVFCPSEVSLITPCAPLLPKRMRTSKDIDTEDLRDLGHRARALLDH